MRPRLLLLLMAVLVLAGCSGAPFAVVDSDRVLNGSVRALSYQKQLDEREKAMALDLQLLANKIPKADLAARGTQYQKELEQMKAALEAQLNKEIREVAAVIVREKGFRGVVIVKEPVVFALPGRTVDITEEVIAKLK